MIRTMETVKVRVNGKVYECLKCETDEEKEKGLQDVASMEDNEGCLFVYDEPQTLDFWMKDTSIPLDIVFIGEDMKVLSNMPGEPMNEEDMIEEDNAQYVLEVNQGSGIKEGDEVEILDEHPELEVNKVYVMGSDGKPQGEILGGERIFSRVSTRKIIAAAKKAFLSKKDSDYKKLGKIVFNEIKAQDDRDPEYVTNNKANNDTQSTDDK